jgi:hypothetical protein
LMKMAREASALIAWPSKAPLTSWVSRLRYMSGPGIAESQEERKACQSRIVVLPEEASPTGIAL